MRDGSPARTLVRVVLVVAGSFLTACGGSPTAPQMGPVATCPADVRVQSPDGAQVEVTFDLPTASGGSGPIVITCTPAPGAAFPVGSTNVTCTAVDVNQRAGTCGFRVDVLPPPRLSVTKFVAFGDSLTEGVISPPLSVHLLTVPTESYPYKLEQKLRARYVLQSITVTNLGVGGEAAAFATLTSPGGVFRLPGVLDTYRPEVLLLMEGTNDLPHDEAGVEAALQALATMVEDAKARGVRVCLATIPPQRAGTVRNNARAVALIPGFNARIRDLAAREGVVPVDVYAAMADKLYLIGSDDLHPTPQGYDVIATTFFDAIRAAFEPMSVGAAR